MNGKTLKSVYKYSFLFTVFIFIYLLHACYMCTCVNMCVHVEAGVNVRYIPLPLSLYGFGIGSFFDLELISCLEWLANELQGSACLYPSYTPNPNQNSGVTDVHHCTHPLPGCWGSEHRSLSLRSKHFTVSLLVFLD